MKRICALLLFVLLMMAGCGGTNENRIISGNNITPLPPKKEVQAEGYAKGDKEITAALISINTDKLQLLVKDINDGVSYVFNYTGGTDVQSVSGEIIAMTQLKEGEIVDITFDEEKKKARSVYVNKEAFRSSNVRGFKANVADGTITFGSASYFYNEQLVVVSSGQVIMPTEVMSRDVVTVRGFENKIYSVTVDKGHGYLTLTGVKDFVGGMIEIGSSLLYTVSEDMVIVVPEGEHEVVLSSGKQDAKKTLYMSKNMTVTMDFSEFNSPANRTGTIDFQILPGDASLFIEGNEVDYKKPVELEYGSYIINIISEKYDTYTTRINVDSTYKAMTYDLAKLTNNAVSDEKPTSTPQTTTIPTSSAAPSTTTSTTTVPTTATNTAGTTGAGGTTGSTTQETNSSNSGPISVTISKPIGAGVYVDNEFVGTAPVTINKNPGEHVITFKKEGYITKSYTVDIESLDGQQELGFPDMSEE